MRANGKPRILTAEDVKRFCCNRQVLNDEELAYLDFHAQRLAYTTNLVQKYSKEFSAKTLLDVGPHFLISCMKQFIRPDVSVSTLGWANERLAPSRLVDDHIQFDLNLCSEQNVNRIGRRFDLIVFAETVKHLHTSPVLVLKMLKNALRENAGVLIIQTPNAVSLSKRLAMVRGINPFERIRESRDNPGHFREYTMNELVALGNEVGLSLHHKEFCDYWDSHIELLRPLEKVYPPFRKAITVAFVS